MHRKERDMIRDLQTLLHDALKNNTYDYEVMQDTLDSTLKSSFSYLYFVQKASVEYEELFRYSGDEYTRDFTQVGHLYLDSMNFANFDIDYEFIKPFVTEKFRQSSYDFRFNHFKDLVENPDIFEKIPIVIIDDKVIWDYEIRITKDGATFKLPYRWEFVYEQMRNSKNKMDYVYIYHEIKVLIVNNCYYQRIGDKSNVTGTLNKNTVHDYINSKITIPKTFLKSTGYYEVYSIPEGIYQDRRMTPTEFEKYDGHQSLYTMDSQKGLGQTEKTTGFCVKENGVDIFLLPKNKNIPTKEHGIMMCTVHFPTNNTFEYKVPSESVLDKMIDGKDHPLFDPITPDDIKDEIHDIEYEIKTKTIPKGFELGSMLIPLVDDGDNYVGKLDEYTNDLIWHSSGNIYISCVFMENLHCHTFYTGNSYTVSRGSSIDYAVIEDEDSDEVKPYNMPIPVENFMVFKTSAYTHKTQLMKNVVSLSMHYPNIYEIIDGHIQNDQYQLFYFYDPKYTSLTEYYTKYISDKFKDYGNFESVLNKICFEELRDENWTYIQNRDFQDDVKEIINYVDHIYKYGEADFLDRYLME